MSCCNEYPFLRNSIYELRLKSPQLKISQIFDCKVVEILLYHFEYQPGRILSASFFTLNISNQYIFTC